MQLNVVFNFVYIAIVHHKNTHHCHSVSSSPKMPENISKVQISPIPMTSTRYLKKIGVTNLYIKYKHCCKKDKAHHIMIVNLIYYLVRVQQKLSKSFRYLKIRTPLITNIIRLMTKQSPIGR